jgi:hypothetical protein
MTKIMWPCLLLALTAGCDPVQSVSQSQTKKPQPSAPAPPTKKVEVGKNVFFEILPGDKRRVRVNAYVCLRMGQLEQLLTRRRTKEHEAILAADVDARDIHTALTLARAEAGQPVKFQPQYQPASGTPIMVFLEYTKDSKTVRVPAQHWIRNMKTQKILESDWVFAGSVLIPDPLDPKKKPFYAANDGDVICISNFDSALLDLPLNSSKGNDDLLFEAFTERIPAAETPVQVLLEPIVKEKKK